MNIDTWRILIQDEMNCHGDSFDNVVYNTMTAEEMDVEFDGGFGVPEEIPFTVWTKSRVYFPQEYDGAESVGSASRNPDGKVTPHMCPSEY